MSGFSESSTCPNCGKSADSYTDWKPFNYSILTCMYCGLRIYPTNDYMNLEELNEYRAENDMRPLKRLPKQSDNIW